MIVPVSNSFPDYHRSYDRLQYPLLFPDGQDGWHFGLNYSALDHASYMMMDRDGIINPILFGRGIGQQWIVDQYCKVELERLRWVELNQDAIHAELYLGVADSYLRRSPTEGGNFLKPTGVTRRTPLPMPTLFLTGSISYNDLIVTSTLSGATILLPSSIFSIIFTREVIRPPSKFNKQQQVQNQGGPSFAFIQRTLQPSLLTKLG